MLRNCVKPELGKHIFDCAFRLKQEKIDATLKELDKSNLPLNTKVDRYVKSLVDIYGKDAIDPEKSHPVQQMEGLLVLNSVQDQLHNLPLEQRKQEKLWDAFHASTFARHS